MKCILDERKKQGCKSCDGFCAHRIALHGLNNEGGRVGLAGAPYDYRHLTLATSPAKDVQKKNYAFLEKYAKTFTRNPHSEDERIKSMYLWSENPGTGKTTTAVALMNEFIMSNYLSAIKRGEQPPLKPALFLDLNEQQEKWNLAVQTDDTQEKTEVKELFREAAKVPFLVIDDVGIRSATEAFRSMLHTIVNKRATGSYPTIYTSNVSMKEFIRIYDARIYDRARDKCMEVHFDGDSKRGK